MRISLAALAALALAGCMGQTASKDGSSDAAAGTTLEISVWVGGTKGPVRIWTLRCPDAGTLPEAAEACKKLASIEDPFAPVPANSACTMIYGGPQVAQVVGRFEGKPVNAKFSRTDGCEIERWEKVRFLFPVST